MSNAFEITEDDVSVVVTDRLGRKTTPEEVERLHSELDHGAIEAAALHGDDMDDQTEYAHQEIERQVREILEPTVAPATP